MIYLKIVIEIVLLGVAYFLGNNYGYNTGYEDGVIDSEESNHGICEDCQKDIFEAGWIAGRQTLIEEQEAHRIAIIQTAEMHLGKAVTKKKEVKKVAKKVTKKNK